MSGQLPDPGWVDLHVHYLPGIDDGPATFAETLAMLRLAHDSGSRVLVATPHLYSPVAPSLRPDDVRRAFDRAHRALAEAAGRPEHRFLTEMTFLEGAENHLSPELIDDLEQQRAVTLDGGRHLLLELPPVMPYDPVRNAIERIVDLGYLPVLAHVERYPILTERPARLATLLQLGCVAQVNAAAASGAGGRQAARQVRRLLDDGLATIVASDGHNTGSRPPDLGAAAAELAPAAGEARIAAWLREAPARLLRATAPLGPG